MHGWEIIFFLVCRLFFSRDFSLRGGWGVTGNFHFVHRVVMDRRMVSFCAPGDHGSGGFLLCAGWSRITWWFPFVHRVVMDHRMDLCYRIDVENRYVLVVEIFNTAVCACSARSNKVPGLCPSPKESVVGPDQCNLLQDVGVHACSNNHFSDPSLWYLQ
jgi:hypothetical protein